MNPENRYVNLEPNWNNMRQWALNGLRSATIPETRSAFLEVLEQCDRARAAGRPDADWIGPTIPPVKVLDK